MKLLKGLIKDQSDRSPYSHQSQSNTYVTSTVGSYPPTNSSTTGAALRNRNVQQAQSSTDPQDADDEDPKAEQQPVEEVLTLQIVLA